MLAHVVNDLGLFGAGVAKSIAEKWPFVRDRYRLNHEVYQLGDVQYIPVDEGHWVANMFAQSGLHSRQNRVPLSYVSLQMCLMSIAQFARSEGVNNIRMPRIGCGLARGQWTHVLPMIRATLLDKGFEVTVCDLPDR